MHWLDVVAVLLLVGAGLAFVAGESALARAEDLQAIYWLAVGALGLQAAAHFGRPVVR